MEILVVVLSWLLFGGASSYFASQRGRDPFAWFLIGMLLGILGLLLLFLLPPIKKENEATEDIEELSNENLPETDVSFRLKEWFYLDENRNQMGPYSFSNLRKMWDQGKLNAKTFVWSDGMDGWKKVDELSGLLDSLS